MMISTHGYVSGQVEMGLPDTGGQVVYVLKLSECLARLGYRVDIFTRRFEDQPATEKISDRVRIVRIRAGGPDLIRKEWLCEVIPEWVANAEAYVKRKDLSYAFINSHYWDAGLAGDELSSRLHTSHLHTPHSIGAWKRDNMDGDPADLEREYNFERRIRDERAIYDSADSIIATTPQQRELLVGGEYEVDPAKIAVIPPGFDDSRFFPVSFASREAIKRELGVDGRLILALGRVAANKGYDLLLQAMPTVFERLPDARLMLALGSSDPTPGETAQVEELKRLAAELGIADRVIFRDFVPDDDLAGPVPGGRCLRSEQPLRAVRDDRRRGHGLRDAGRRDDRRRALADGGVGHRSLVRGSTRPAGVRPCHHDDPSLPARRPPAGAVRLPSSPGVIHVERHRPPDDRPTGGPVELRRRRGRRASVDRSRRAPRRRGPSSRNTRSNGSRSPPRNGSRRDTARRRGSHRTLRPMAGAPTGRTTGSSTPRAVRSRLCRP